MSMLLAACLAWPPPVFAQHAGGDAFVVVQREKAFQRKKQRKRTPVTPGSEVVMLKDRRKAEIRPDGTVWWFGSNQKKALMADGDHPLLDGRTLTTQNGKMIHMTDPSAPKKSAQTTNKKL